MQRILWILFFSLTFCPRLLACGPFERTNSIDEYFTFRVCGNNMKGDNPQIVYLDREEQQIENCRSWAKLTSWKIPIPDIQRVVYLWSYRQLQQLYDKAKIGNADSIKNRFAKWIVQHKDLEIASFLLLAKRSESIRQIQNSAWYYYSEEDEVNVGLDNIIEEAKTYKQKRLLDRYTLQMMRTYIAKQQYEQCVNLWLERSHVFKNDVILNMAKGYVAGAYYHTGRIETAKGMFLEIGDMSSYQLCLKKEGLKYDAWDLFLHLYQKNPNSQKLLSFLQYFIHKEEYGYSKDFSELNSFVLNVIQEKRVKNLAAWYYAASFTFDKLGDLPKSWEYIQKAGRCKMNPELKDAIRVFRIYLATKRTSKYNPQFENYIFNELVWLDGKIVSDLDADTKKHISSVGFYNHVCRYSQYYWNDMMRKIVIAQVVPLCISSGYKTRALQFLNYADNRIFNLVGVSRSWHSGDDCIDIQDYRMRKDEYNRYDYQNDFFMNLDSMGVKYVKRLAYRMKRPMCKLDHFLNERSYSDLQYLYEIIGTQLIASMQYDEAIDYFRLVSDSFAESRNTYSEMKYNPFGKFKEKTVWHNCYKLRFAQAMHSLEKKIEKETNLNDKADYLLMYVRGLQNSVGECWALTSYYQGYWYCFPFYSSYQKKLRAHIIQKAEALKEKAFGLYTDSERAAQAYYDWSLFKTAATRYPDTQVAKFIRGHCDEWVDYK